MKKSGSKNKKGIKKAFSNSKSTESSQLYLVIPSIFLILVITSLWMFYEKNNSLRRQPTTISKQTKLVSIEEAACLAAEYLEAQVLGNGQFIYRVNLDNSVNLKARYNILRHAGTIYALGTYDEGFSNDIVKQARLKAGAFLRSQIAAVPEHPKLLERISKHLMLAKPIGFYSRS